MKKLTSKHVYVHYQSMGGDLPYSVFMRVISTFNQDAMAEILEGRELDMGCNMSRLSVVKLQRDYSKLSVNWNESRKLKQEIIDEGGTPRSKEHPEGEPYLVYFTDEWFLRFYWEKFNCKIQNRTAYRFDATRGLKGNKTALKELLAKDPIAHLNFRQLV